MKLKDIFFQSDYVGQGLYTYDKYLSSIENIKTMEELVENETAINKVASNEKVINAIAKSEVAMNAVANSETAMDVMVSNQLSMDAIFNNKEAMKEVAQSVLAIDKITSSEVATNTLIKSEIALDAIFSSPVAKLAIFGKDIITSAIANNISVIEWLENNKGIETSFYMGDNPPPRTITEKKALLLRWKSTAPTSSRLYSFSTRVGSVGEITGSQAPPTNEWKDNVMMCEPLVMKRTGVGTTNPYVIYIPME